jgi:hypothetical protein
MRSVVASVMVMAGFSVPALAAPEPTLAELLAEYRALGLPFPPAGAELVRHEGRDGGIGFLVRWGTYGRPFRLIYGLSDDQFNWDIRPRLIDPDPKLVKGIIPYKDDTLVMAIHCHARGWDRLAQYLYDQSRVIQSSPPLERVRVLAWEHWAQEYLKSPADRPRIVEKLRAIRAALVTPEWTRRCDAEMLKLDLLSAPRRGLPGSIRSQVEDLAECYGGGESDPYFDRVARLGFDAVPYLIDHIFDDRPTRAARFGFFPSSERDTTVGGMALRSLEGISAEEYRWNRFFFPDKAEIQHWWREARQVGEEKYLFDHIERQEERGGARHLNFAAARGLSLRYPGQILRLYREVLRGERVFPKGDEDTSEVGYLARCVARCNLPRRDKIEVLTWAARHPDRERRFEGLSALAGLDPERFAELLTRAIDDLPTTDTPRPGDPTVPPDRPRSGLRPGAPPQIEYMDLVLMCPDERPWRALDRLTRRLDAKLRLEVIDEAGQPTAAGRPQQIRFLTGFLGDAGGRDLGNSPHRSREYAVGHTIERLEVRNWAARYLALILGLPYNPQPDWSPRQWSELRLAVLTEVARMKREGVHP